MHQISVIFFNIVYFSHGWRGLFDDNKDNLRSRSAIEAHRPRSASWKRSMPPLSPQIKNLRGPRTLESYGEADRSNACEIRIPLGRARGESNIQKLLKIVENYFRETKIRSFRATKINKNREIQ